MDAGECVSVEWWVWVGLRTGRQRADLDTGKRLADLQEELLRTRMQLEETRAAANDQMAYAHRCSQLICVFCWGVELGRGRESHSNFVGAVCM